jgi:enoyl-CoA hydratase
MTLSRLPRAFAAGASHALSRPRTLCSASINRESFENFHFSYDGEVLVVEFNRPNNDGLNMVNDSVHHEFARLFRTLSTERRARAVLLTGSDRAFSAGGEFEWFPTLQEHDGRVDELRLDARAIFYDLLDMPLPLVTAVTGHALGFGASIALLSDVVVAAESAKIGDPHVMVGLVAGDGGVVAWPLALGPMLAKRFLLTGDSIGAEEAMRLGLVAEVHPDAEKTRAAGLKLAKKIASRSPLAVQYTKQAINGWMKQTSGSAFDHGLSLEMMCVKHPDHTEAVRALIEKRKPVFTGGRR